MLPQEISFSRLPTHIRQGELSVEDQQRLKELKKQGPIIGGPPSKQNTVRDVESFFQRENVKKGLSLEEKQMNETMGNPATYLPYSGNSLTPNDLKATALQEVGQEEINKIIEGGCNAKVENAMDPVHRQLVRKERKIRELEEEIA